MTLYSTARYLRAASLRTMAATLRAQELHRQNTAEAVNERVEDFLLKLKATPDGTEKHRLIARYMRKAKKFGRAIVQGSTVHFFYWAKANQVSVPSDLNGWSASADTMMRIEETGLFYLPKTVERAARFEYKLAVDSTWILDPVNKQVAIGGYGPNSEVWMPAYRSPDEIAYRKDVAHGKVHTLSMKSEALKRTHPCLVYLPAGYAQSREIYPTIYVLDGGEYITLALMLNVLDNLIANHSIVPVVGVFVDPRTDIRNSKTSKRTTDYTMNAAFVRFLADELRPFIATKYRVHQCPEHTAIMGASLGGLASTYAAYQRADAFGLCAAQSPSYAWKHEAMTDMIASGPKKALRFCINTGTIRDAQVQSQRLKITLEQKGYDFQYAEYPEGHNWVNWRARIGEILTFFWGTRE